jgi:hypothetical protein
MYKIDVKYLDQMVIKYTNISHCKSLQNLPNSGFRFKIIASGNPAVGTTKKWSAVTKDVKCKRSRHFFFCSNRAKSIGFKLTTTKMAWRKGCQIFLDTIYQNGRKCTKLPLNYQITTKYYQMAITHSKWA